MADCVQTTNRRFPSSFRAAEDHVPAVRFRVSTVVNYLASIYWP
jgi:hypothetical protein